MDFFYEFSVSKSNVCVFDQFKLCDQSLNRTSGQCKHKNQSCFPMLRDGKRAKKSNKDRERGEGGEGKREKREQNKEIKLDINRKKFFNLCIVHFEKAVLFKHTFQSFLFVINQPINT